MRTFFILSLLVLLSFLHGCALLSSRDSEALAVWSEDGRGIALVQNLADNPPQHQLFIQNPDGSARRPISGPRKARVSELYYQREAGYLVVETQRDDGWQQIDRIHLDGGEISIVEAQPPQQLCPAPSANSAKSDHAFSGLARHFVIPSPDGKLIAHAYSEECAKVQVELLRAVDLIALNAYTLPVTGPAALTWHPVGYLVLADTTAHKAWRMHVNEPPKEEAFPACLAPPTASGSVSQQGKQVIARGAEVQIIEVDKATPVFGCQLSVH